MFIFFKMTYVYEPGLWLEPKANRFKIFSLFILKQGNVINIYLIVCVIHPQINDLSHFKK